MAESRARLCDGCVRDNCPDVCPYMPDDWRRLMDNDDGLMDRAWVDRIAAGFAGASPNAAAAVRTVSGIRPRWHTAHFTIFGQTFYYGTHRGNSKKNRAKTEQWMRADG